MVISRYRNNLNLNMATYSYSVWMDGPSIKELDEFFLIFILNIVQRGWGKDLLISLVF